MKIIRSLITFNMIHVTYNEFVALGRSDQFCQCLKHIFGNIQIKVFLRDINTPTYDKKISDNQINYFSFFLIQSNYLITWFRHRSLRSLKTLFEQRKFKIKWKNKRQKS